MKPLATTMLMALMAFASGAAAWYFFPRIESQDQVARTSLLTEDEEFEPRDVREITIVRFDRGSNTPEKFQLKLNDGSWVIPGRRSYPANNTARVSALVTSFRDKDVLETVSDNKDDHEEYGVLDVSELGSTGLGAGTVITFEGRQGKRLGKMIVGRSPDEKPGQRYVRLAGQPQIYVVEFDSRVLTTEFSDWVDGAILPYAGRKIGAEQLVNQIETILIDLYYRNSAEDETRTNNYRAEIRRGEQDWIYSLWKPGEDQTYSEAPDITSQPVNFQALANMMRTVMSQQGQPGEIVLTDVTRKQETVALDLSDPKATQPASHFDSIRNLGFYHAGFQMGQHQFDSAAGEIRISYRGGLETVVNIGNLNVDVAVGGKITRYLMVTANVNPDLVPEPVKESSGEVGSDSGDEAGASENQEDAAERKYQAAVKKRAEAISVAHRLAKAFNQLHADWIYLVPDEAIKNLIPAADAWERKTE